MEITEVRIKLMDDPQERLQAFCSITFDSCFVIRDLKIIEGAKGSFVAMPSRKLTDHCPQCNTKNHLRSLYCNQCGAKLQEDRACKDDDGRAKLYADIAHPINSRCREMIQARVLESFDEELVRAHEPGYVCRYDDYGEDAFAALAEDDQSGENEENREAETEQAQPAASSAEQNVEEAKLPSTVRSGGSIHRIEPGSPEPSTPHQTPSSQQERKQVAVPQTESTDEVGEFGDGIF